MEPSQLKHKDMFTQFGVGVESECGKLDIVLMHRPGREFHRLTKDNLDELLFDAIPIIEEAHRSHDYYTKYLRDQGVCVLYVRDLLRETLISSGEARSMLIEGIVAHSYYSESDQKQAATALQQWLSERTPEQLSEDAICGVAFSKDELGNSVHAQILLEANKPNSKFLIPPLPNLLFTRDLFSIIEKNVFIWQMAKPARRNEPLLVRIIFKFHPYLSTSGLKIVEWQKKNANDEFPTIEGGDVAYLGQGILMIGCSERTNRAGIEELTSTRLFHQVIAIMIPHKRDYMHLDTVLSSVGKHAFTLHGPLADKMEVCTVENQSASENISSKPRWISHGSDLRQSLRNLLNNPRLTFYDAEDEETSVDDQRQCHHNVFVIDNCHVATYAGGDPKKSIITQMTRNNVCRVIQIPSEGLVDGGGGTHCITNAIRRQANKM